MNYILHLTNDCNLNCKYCYEKDKYTHQKLSFEKITALIDNEILNHSNSVGISFYGGEPLLEKEIIYKVVDYINKAKSKTKFLFNITTNGILLDDEFIKFMKKNKFLNIGYSIDGTKENHNLNRSSLNSTDTFDIIEKNAIKLLKNFKETIAMVVVTKNTINRLTENVEYLINLGFKVINLQFDFHANWTDKDLIVIKENYEKLADLYINKILQGTNISIPLFDDKIESYINNKYNCNDSCNLGTKSVCVGADGNLYPCIQFVGNKKYVIGNCIDGISGNKLDHLSNKSHKELKICKECKVRKRCKHLCACRNLKTTNDINQVSPLTCETERMIISIADRIANHIYKEKPYIFLKKFYIKRRLYYGIKKYKK